MGGLARFVYAGSKEGPRGLFTANTDATLRNLEITGANNWSGNMAGLYVAAGNVTLANSFIHDNNVGLAAAESSAITLGIFAPSCPPTATSTTASTRSTSAPSAA